MMGLYELHGKDREQCELPLMNESTQNTLRNVLVGHQPSQITPQPRSNTLSTLSIPPTTENTANKFPHNIAFFTSDWVHNPIPTDKDSYDVVLAFSISKWIHLNGGDDAVMKIFNRVYMVLNHGVFVLGPQSWETYGKARKMDEKLRTNANTLT